MTVATPTPVRYPLWLGIASFMWALVGWMLALHAPAMAFWPAVEVLHVVLPSVTGLLILLNLRYALRALWSGVKIDRLMLVTALQIGLFTTLFHQIAAHQGAEHFKLTGPTTPGQWVQFSLAHALKATDVLDTIEAYGLNVQVVKHDGTFAATLLVAYHIVVDVFVLGVLWAVVGSVRRKLMSDPAWAWTVRKWLVFLFLGFLAVWAASALYLRAWRHIDIPLWLAENIVRVVDFSDAMDSYDIHWHQVPKEWQESTLTFACRIWIALGIGLVMGRVGRAKPADETPSVKRVMRLAFAGVLFAGFVGLPAAVPEDRPEQAAGLVVAVREPAEDRASAALRALRRMGPNAETAVGPLTAMLPAVGPDRREAVVAILGRLGPTALPHLLRLAEGADAGVASAAVRGLACVGVDAAPALVGVWARTPHEAVRGQADTHLRELGTDAMPKLIAAVGRDTSAEFHHWFEQLDRNWTLRETGGSHAFRAVVQWSAQPVGSAGRLRASSSAGSVAVDELVGAMSGPDADARRAAAQVLREIGPVAVRAVPELIARLSDPDPITRSEAAEVLGAIGPGATAAVPRLTAKLADGESWDRIRAADAIGKIRVGAAVAVPPLIGLLGEKKEIQDAAVAALGKIGEPAVAPLMARLAVEMTTARHELVIALGLVGPAAEPAIPLLVDKLSDWALAADATTALGQIGVAAVPHLAAPLANDKTAERSCWILQHIGAAARDAVPNVLPLLAEGDHLGAVAWKTLEKIDPLWHRSEATNAAVSRWTVELANPAEDRRRAAARALGRCGTAAASSVPRLVRGLSDPAWVVRSASAEALGRIGVAPADVVPQLVLLLGDRQWAVRSDAARALGAFGPVASEAVPALEALRSDKEYLVGNAAADALTKIKKR